MAILVIVFIIAIFGWQYKTDTSDITIAVYPEKTVTVERMYFSWGPYNYCSKTNRIYRIYTGTHTYWYRTATLFGSPDLYLELDGGNEYKQVEIK